MLNCGDKGLDDLQEKGEIISIDTCCGNSVYGDHECRIALENGDKIFSYVSGITKLVQITREETVYEKTVTGGMANFILSFFGKSNQSAPQPEFSKGPAGEDFDKNKQSISEKEFNDVLSTLPPSIQTYLEKREKESNNVYIMSNSNRNQMTL
ncbi:hypothetical protein Lsan_0138 [Legionella santicrucis]|uniref:Uncharacterized protein n=1 Tax=Legionella santicrucis TaxID=45074 RepID=A0A0W0ZLE0_9GAMM|nr:hypothetical protein [Legionella santicrucis]KTD69860.1 hypothetical protein Lsan_0138 [Legionella santicrucis]